jgi:hypothetical protein
MKEMTIYEPAMCCPTGLCGVGVDPELLRISAVLGSLKKNGVEVQRFNLTNAPAEFVKNSEINELISAKGVRELPAVVLDGRIVITGRYPANKEFISLLEVPESFLSRSPKPVKINVKTGGCGCTGGKCC